MIKHFFFFSFFCFFALIETKAQSPSRPVLQLLFNQGLDDEGSGNHQCTNNGVSYTTDRFGNTCGAVLMNGSSYVSVKSSTALNNITKITISAWVKVRPAQKGKSWITLVCKGTSSTEDSTCPQFRFQSTPQTYSLNTGFTEPVSLNYDFDVWYHYTQTFDGKKVVLYRDGLYVTEYAFAGKLWTNNQNLEIGRDVPGNLEFFNGCMDDLRVYNYALSAAEVKNVYLDNSEKTSPKPCSKPTPVITPPVKPKTTVTATAGVGNNPPVVKKSTPPPPPPLPPPPPPPRPAPVGKPPFIRIEAPLISGKLTTTPNDVALVQAGKVRAKVTNVSNSSQITCYLDGEEVPFYFDSKSKMIEISVNIGTGISRLEIEAINDYGAAFDYLDLSKMATPPPKPNPSPKPTPRPEPKPPVIDPTPIEPDPIADLEEEMPDSVSIVQSIEVPTGKIRIVVYDNRKVDNDTVTISLNNEVLFENIALKGKTPTSPSKVVNLRPNVEYLLLAKSINEGDIATNTLKIELYNDDTGYLRQIELVSAKGVTQGIRLKYVGMHK